MAIVQNAQDVSAFSCGSIDPKTRLSITRTRSQHSVPQAGEPDASVDPSPTTPSNPTASLTEVTARCESADDLSNGKLQRFLDLAENGFKYTLEKAQLILPHTNTDPSPVYQHAVHADRFLALQSLYIGGFFPTTTSMYTFRSLRHLRLCNFYRDLEGTLMSLQEFVAVLGTWTELEDLDLRGYYPALALSEGHPRPPAVTLPNLRKLTVADAPEFFPMLLPCLRLRPTADVHLITLHHKPAYPRNCADAFCPLAFQNRASNFPILSEVDEVTISTASPEQEEYGLRIAGRSASGGSFVYDLRTTASIDLDHDMEFRCWAVDWALQALPRLFPSGARMRTIRCAARLRDVDEKTWVGVLQAYPALEELGVDGCGTEDVSQLFIALGWPSQGTNVMCRTLNRLAVRSAVYTPEFMAEVARCFNHRWYYSRGAAARTVLQLGMVICDHPYSPEHQTQDVAKLKESGVDAYIQAENIWDVLKAIELECGLSA
ncbi:hypothetical protein LXA43DRAFT_1127850 [Ganoderma leucocontextum]|nr:hypothetical protein LXA43DRAFT_1127850 [Ganoderma leucocontextum]